MRRIAVINQKGGVGKTTTAVNLAAALAERGERVLMVDLDPQTHLTLHTGLDPAGGAGSVYEVLTQNRSLSDVRVAVTERLWAIGSHIDLAAAELELAGVVGREVILRDALEAHTEVYDYVLLDCPPSLGLLTLNALAAATEVFIPLQPHYLALHGLGKLLETVALVRRRINPDLRVTAIIVCMHEAGTRLAAEVLADIETFLAGAQNRQTPWSEARMLDPMIRRNIKLAECPSYGQTIFQYAPTCHGAEDYRALAESVARMQQSTTAGIELPDAGHPDAHDEAHETASQPEALRSNA
jgi:chromosome partitioning protein